MFQRPSLLATLWPRSPRTHSGMFDVIGSGPGPALGGVDLHLEPLAVQRWGGVRDTSRWPGVDPRGGRRGCLCPLGKGRLQSALAPLRPGADTALCSFRVWACVPEPGRLRRAAPGVGPPGSVGLGVGGWGLVLVGGEGLIPCAPRAGASSNSCRLGLAHRGVPTGPEGAVPLSRSTQTLPCRQQGSGLWSVLATESEAWGAQGLQGLGRTWTLGHLWGRPLLRSEAECLRAEGSACPPSFPFSFFSSRAPLCPAPGRHGRP